MNAPKVWIRACVWHLTCYCTKLQIEQGGCGGGLRCDSSRPWAVVSVLTDVFLYLQVYLHSWRSADELNMLVGAKVGGATPLVIACRNGHYDVAEYLIERCKADIEQPGSGKCFIYYLNTCSGLGLPFRTLTDTDKKTDFEKKNRAIELPTMRRLI